MWNRVNLANLSCPDAGRRYRACVGIVQMLEYTAQRKGLHFPLFTEEKPFPPENAVPIEYTNLLGNKLLARKGWLSWDDGEKEDVSFSPYTKEWLDKHFMEIHGREISRGETGSISRIIGYKPDGKSIVGEYHDSDCVGRWNVEVILRHWVFADTGEPVGIKQEQQWIDW